MVVIENVEIGRKEVYRSAAWSGLLSPSFYKVCQLNSPIDWCVNDPSHRNHEWVNFGISGTILDEDKDHFRTLSITHKK